MMNRILFYAFFLVLNLSYAQNRFPTAGSVGIGTTEPLYDLDVRGDGFFSGAITTSRSGEIGGQMRIVNPSKLSSGTANSWIIYNMTGGYGNSLQFWAYDNLGCVGGMCSNRFTIMDNGNVGIGMNNPLAKFEVTGGGITTSLANINSTLTQRINTANPAISVGLGYLNSDMPFLQSFNSVSLSSNSLNINPFGGNVGIGVTNPKNKLDVKGIIHSQEVNVDMDNWSDFVFKKEYNLPTLQEVEKHIAEKGHLENIPSEEEVLKNGINLGEMNAKLLQKIEEMTLYMIEMKKEIELLKKNEK